MLCTTPAQGHTAPLLALAGRLIGDGHDVAFFTTEHYRHRVEATGARFVPFAAEDDAHDLMVANPERESSSRRGVRGVKDDLRRIFIGRCRAIPRPGAPSSSASGRLHRGRLHVLRRPPLALGPGRPAPRWPASGSCPPSNSRDTAPFGVAFQPGGVRCTAFATPP